MRKGQNGEILPVVIMALVIPLLLTLFYIVQANMTNQVEGTITLSVTDENVSFSATNGTATSLANNYVYEVTDVSGGSLSGTLVEGTNYTVQETAGTITIIDAQNNGSYANVDYTYIEDDERTTFDNIAGSADDTYDISGILPIVMVGVAILIAILAAVGGLVVMRS